ncbi:MAG: hypothetical protein H6704_13290 [Myxococcales bacterium]|nr:hypothetical protein [Myxococcales bacterium]MCB9537220.1 hypothetical protein [Myxococcales bacterium]
MENPEARRLSGGERATVALIVAEAAVIAWLGFGWADHFVAMYGALLPTMPALTRWSVQPMWAVGQLGLLAAALWAATRARPPRRAFALGGVAALALLLLMATVVGLYLPLKPIR